MRVLCVAKDFAQKGTDKGSDGKASVLDCGDPSHVRRSVTLRCGLCNIRSAKKQVDMYVVRTRCRREDHYYLKRNINIQFLPRNTQGSRPNPQDGLTKNEETRSTNRLNLSTQQRSK